MKSVSRRKNKVGCLIGWSDMANEERAVSFVYFFFFFVNAVSIQFWIETAGVLKRQGYRRSLSAPRILAFSAHFRGLM